jgi:hypothetical protein
VDASVFAMPLTLHVFDEMAMTMFGVSLPCSKSRVIILFYTCKQTRSYLGLAVTAPRAPDTEDEPEADEAGEEEISNRPKRMRRPSSRYNGPEWVAQQRGVVPNAAT